ncbi:high-affinity glucose transporter [Brettanomyces nanus]|uniref:High-affinity glucose transporter n=1 Tax=Eeniella nana TaxID=13502 RepID=A0A875RP61_EENNA|nr:high-affinity glucose transporter [Brettanomyces nanus]QPG74630.1 high-affinity glucose transporter [Brettanomyces nanus]
MSESINSRDNSLEREESAISKAALQKTEDDVPENMDTIELPSAFSKQYLPLYGICLVVYFVSTMQGYDGSLMGSIYTMKDYLAYYNLDVNSSTGTGLVFSIYNVGQITGAFFVWIMDWKGRKIAIMIGCFGAIVGAIITAATTNKEGLIGGRWFLSFFTTIANTAAPSYCVEVSPPHIRGKVAGLYNTLWYCGSILAAFTTYGTNKNFAGSSLSFKIPLYVQVCFPGLVVLFGWFLPESPRWLVGVGRYDEARKFLVKYHCNGDDSNPLVDLEMAEMEESFKDVKISDPLTAMDIRPLFKNRSDRYRLGLVVAMAWFGQFSGNNVCSYYLPTMLIKVGMTSVSTNVLMNGVYSIVSWISSILGSFAHDKVGRRKMFMISTLGSALALTGLAVCTARYEATQSDGASKGTLVFIYLFGVIFSFAFTPMQPIYPGEVSSNLIRGKAQFVLSIVAGVAQFVNQFASPKAMENIRYWFYVFYAFFDIFEFIIIYFFFVETRGKTLEELEYVFEAPNPRKASTDPEFLSSIRVASGFEAENMKNEHDIKATVDHLEEGVDSE